MASRKLGRDTEGMNAEITTAERCGTQKKKHNDGALWHIGLHHNDGALWHYGIETGETMRWMKSVARKAGLNASLVLAFGAFLVSTTTAEAHFPFRRHHWGHHHWGHHHWGHHHWGYRSFGYYAPLSLSVYAYRPWLHHSYSVGFYSTPVYYYPTYYYPTYYAPSWYYYSVPAISWPFSTYYTQPFCATNWNSPLSTFNGNTAGPMIATKSNIALNGGGWDGIGVSRTMQLQKVPLMLRQTQDADDTSVRLVSNNKERIAPKSASSRLVVSRNPRIVEPYSPIWTKAAVGLVDTMIREGRFEDAVSSCKSMEKITQPKGAGVYLRQGITCYFSQDTRESAKLEQALSFFDLASRAGAQFKSSEIAQGSLSKYLSACSIDVSSAFDQLSRQVLDKPETSMKELLLLSAMLKLDGQTERAKLFAAEAQVWVAANPRWQELQQACMQD